MKHSSKLVLSAVALASAAFAQTSFAEESLAYNVGVVSEYRYRSLGQTKGNPALQGGVDYDSGKGFYVGAWASTIQWIKDAAPNTDATMGPLGKKATGPVELDLYGGYKFEAGGAAFDVGYLRYEYVGNKYKDIGGTAVNANTDELYGAATYGPFTLKYSQAISNIFGYGDSKGSTYWDLSATFDLGDGYTLVPHAGRQNYKKNEAYSYTDVALTLNKDLGNGLSASLSAISTNGKEAIFKPLSDTGYNAAKSTLVVGLKYTF